MGASTMSKDVLKQQSGQAITRMNIHRSKKLTKIARDKDEICKHLNAQNEVNAKIYCETLINEEGKIPCYDIAGTLCDQVKGRAEYLSKFGSSKDMWPCFATLIHIAPKMEVEELMVVRKQLIKLNGKEFAKRADEDKTFINQVVAKNIDFRMPSDGEIVFRMKELAQERNIQYTPSQAMQQALNSYLDQNGKAEPGGNAVAPLSVPAYNPHDPVANMGAPPQQPPAYNPGPPSGYNPGPPPGGPPPYNPGQGGPPPYQPGPPVYQPGPPVQPGYQPGPGGPPPYQPGPAPAGPPPGQPVYQPPPATEYMPPQAPAQVTSFPVYDPNQGGGNQPAFGQPVIGMPPSQDNNQKQNGADDLDDLEARLRALDGK